MDWWDHENAILVIIQLLKVYTLHTHTLDLLSKLMLISKILGCEANTSNVFKYLELGIYPLRFKNFKRKILFLHYILNQEKSSMIYKVFQATCENTIRNDSVKGCEKYMKNLKISSSTYRRKRINKVKSQI